MYVCVFYLGRYYSAHLLTCFVFLSHFGSKFRNSRHPPDRRPNKEGGGSHLVVQREASASAIRRLGRAAPPLRAVKGTEEEVGRRQEREGDEGGVGKRRKVEAAAADTIDDLDNLDCLVCCDPLRPLIFQVSDVFDLF